MRIQPFLRKSMSKLVQNSIPRAVLRAWILQPTLRAERKETEKKKRRKSQSRKKNTSSISRYLLFSRFPSRSYGAQLFPTHLLLREKKELLHASSSFVTEQMGPLKRGRSSWGPSSNESRTIIDRACVRCGTSSTRCNRLHPKEFLARSSSGDLFSSLPAGGGFHGRRLTFLLCFVLKAFKVIFFHLTLAGQSTFRDKI